MKKRICAVIMCLLLAVNLVGIPKAKAVVSEGALLGSIFGSLLVSMGYSWAAENMDMPSFGEAIYNEMKEFDEALKNDSGLSFLADLNLTLLTPLGAGKIGFPVQWVRAANSFAEWFQGKFLSDNTSAVVYSDSGFITLNGVAYPIKAIDLSGWKKLGSSYYIDSASKSLITGGSMKSLFDSGSHSFSYDGKVKTIEFKTSLDPANNNYRLNIYVDVSAGRN